MANGIKEVAKLHLVRTVQGAKKHIGIIHEFKDFLKEYKIVGLAVGFIMATAATTMVQSIVTNLIMPLISPLIPGGEWQTATLSLGPVAIGWGPLLSALINFLILAWAVFIIAKFILQEEKVTKK